MLVPQAFKRLPVHGPQSESEVFGCQRKASEEIGEPGWGSPACRKIESRPTVNLGRRLATTAATVSTRNEFTRMGHVFAQGFNLALSQWGPFVPPEPVLSCWRSCSPAS